VEEIEIEIASTETAKTCLASTRDICRAIYLGHQEYAVTLTGNRATDQFLGTAVGVPLRRINQRHAEGKTCAQRFFLNGLRMSSLSKMPRTLPERRDNDPILEFHGSRAVGSACLDHCA
jgi:hypothetical protein